MEIEQQRGCQPWSEPHINVGLVSRFWEAAMALGLQNVFLIFLSNFPTVNLGMNFWVEDTECSSALRRFFFLKFRSSGWFPVPPVWRTKNTRFSSNKCIEVLHARSLPWAACLYRIFFFTVELVHSLSTYNNHVCALRPEQIGFKVSIIYYSSIKFASEMSTQS